MFSSYITMDILRVCALILLGLVGLSCCHNETQPVTDKTTTNNFNTHQLSITYSPNDQLNANSLTNNEKNSSITQKSHKEASHDEKESQSDEESDRVNKGKDKNDNTNINNNNNNNKDTDIIANTAPRETERFLMMPPFLVGACAVLVLYTFFHCLYMHCYTEKRVRTLKGRGRAQRPTVIISDDAGNGVVEKFTPMLKFEREGHNEFLQAQPFLVCQPYDEAEETTSSRRKLSLQLKVPKLVNKLRRGSKRPSTYSTDSEREPLKVERNRCTRASICFVPIGQSIDDPDQTGLNWTPLQGFVYSSFIVPRRQSYKQACKSRESVSRRSSTMVNSESVDSEGSVIVFPSKSNVRSLSQRVHTEHSKQAAEDVECSLQNSNSLSAPEISVRKQSRVSFNFSEINDNNDRKSPP